MVVAEWAGGWVGGGGWVEVGWAARLTDIYWHLHTLVTSCNAHTSLGSYCVPDTCTVPANKAQGKLYCCVNRQDVCTWWVVEFDLRCCAGLPSCSCDEFAGASVREQRRALSHALIMRLRAWACAMCFRDCPCIHRSPNGQTCTGGSTANTYCEEEEVSMRRRLPQAGQRLTVMYVRQTIANPPQVVATCWFQRTKAFGVQ